MATRRPTSQRKRLNVQRRLLRTTGRVPGRTRAEDSAAEGLQRPSESPVIDISDEPPEKELLLSPAG